MWSEKALTENRLGRELCLDQQLCAFHRFDFGIGWKPPRQCFHPDHKFSAGVKSPACHPVPAPIVLSVSKKFNTHIPLGAQFCFKHLKLETKEESNRTISSPNAQATVPKESMPSHETFVPEDIYISEDTAYVSGINLTCTLDTIPIQYQIKRERVSDLAKSTKQKLKKNFERAQEQLKRKFAEAVAPGQSEEFINDILNDKMEESSTEKEAPEKLIRMSKLYQESDAISSLIILSLVDHEKYIKQLLMKTLGCSKYKIDQARKFRSLNTGIKLAQKQEFVWT